MARLPSMFHHVLDTKGIAQSAFTLGKANQPLGEPPLGKTITTMENHGKPWTHHLELQLREGNRLHPRSGPARRGGAGRLLLYRRHQRSWRGAELAERAERAGRSAA